MTTVFSKNSPILAFNDLKDKTDEDEQLGMMHLFEGAVLGIRNPGGNSFPEGPEQRAVEYISISEPAGVPRPRGKADEVTIWLKNIGRGVGGLAYTPRFRRVEHE